jgi:hypothetical protein
MSTEIEESVERGRPRTQRAKRVESTARLIAYWMGKGWKDCHRWKMGFAGTITPEDWADANWKEFRPQAREWLKSNNLY